MEKGGQGGQISPEQIKKVWAASHEKGWTEERLRDTVLRISGDRSIKALSKKQAKRVIDVLEGKAVLPVPRGNEKVFALATTGQFGLIGQLKTDAGWTDEHLENFILKQFKRGELRKLNRQEAGVVITVLNAAIRKKGVA